MGRSIKTVSGNFYLSYGNDKAGNPNFRDFCELDRNAQLVAAAPELLAALEDLRDELRGHIRFDVKKHYSLMCAEVAADKAIDKAKGANRGN